MAINLDFLNNLKTKAGPFPEYVWVLGIAGLGYLAYRKKKSASTPTQTNTTANTGSATSIDPLTGIPYNQEGNGYTGALLTAQYDQLNALGLNTSQLGILNSNVGNAQTALTSNTTAVNSNTSATNSNTSATTAATNTTSGAAAQQNPQTLAQQDPYVNGLLQAYLKNQTAQNQAVYQNAVNAYYQGFTGAATYSSFPAGTDSQKIAQQNPYIAGLAQQYQQSQTAQNQAVYQNAVNAYIDGLKAKSS